MNRFFTSLICLFVLNCHSNLNASDSPDWMVKGSYDIFSVENSWEGFFGFNPFSDPNIKNMFRSEVEGTLHGGTLSIGKIFEDSIASDVASALTLDISKRSGSFDGDVIVNSINTVLVTYDVDRDDTRIGLTYQFLGSTWQPLFTVSYWRMDQDYAGATTVLGTRLPDVYFELASYNVGTGIGVNLGELMGIRFSGKAVGELMLVDCELGKPGSEPGVDDSAYGFRWEATLQMNKTFNIKNIPTGVFLEGGYQAQQVEFEQIDISHGNLELDWDGFYGRTGIYILF